MTLPFYRHYKNGRPVKPEPAGVESLDWSIPRVEPREIFSQAKAVLICGLDFHIYDWAENIHRSRFKPNLPPVMGHEFDG